MTRKSLRTKRIFSIILSLAVALTMMPMSALAADESSSVGNAVAEGAESDAAQIGEKTYSTLPDAVNAAKDSDTIKLLADYKTVKSADEEEDDVGLTITKSVTLDLNGYKMDYFRVAQVNDEGEILQSGNLTVEDTSTAKTGKVTSKIALVVGNLTINGGTIGNGRDGVEIENGNLTVTGGAIDSLYGSNSGTVTITGGTVKNAQFGEDFNITVTGGSGHTGLWDVSEGTWNISGGEFGDVEFRTESPAKNAPISGGTFGKITRKNLQNGEVAYAPLSGLLADGYAFYQKTDSGKYDGYVKLADAITSLENVQVKGHTHSFVNGVCTVCDYACLHTKMGNDGFCPDCKTQMVAKIEASGGTTTQYADLSTALAAAKDGDTITLLANAAVGNVYLKGKTVTLDLNGKTVKNSSRGSTLIQIGSSNSLASLIITGRGSFISVNQPLVVANGTLDLSQWTGDDSYIRHVTISGANSQFISPTGAGKINTLAFIDSDTGQAADTASLNGGRYGKIVYKRDNTIKLGDLLAEGYAFRQNGTFLEYAKELKNNDTVEEVEVVRCPHVDAEGGKCLYCNQDGILAMVGDTIYDSVSSAVAAWLTNGGTLKLFDDYGQSANGNALDLISAKAAWLAIDLNGHGFYKDCQGDIKLGGGKRLTITDSSGKGTGVFGPVTADRGTLTLESGCLEKLTVPSSSTAKILLRGGKVTDILYPVPIFDLLEDGYALMSGDNPVDPAKSLFGSGVYTIKNSQTQFIDAQKNGEAAIDSNTIPFALSLKTADSEIGQMGFTWYIVKEDGTTQELAATTSDVTPGTNGVYTCNAANMTVNPDGWTDLKANETYKVLCVVNGKTSDGTSKWQTPMRGYQLTVNKATPTGTPKYTAITKEGQTLADANLTAEGENKESLFKALGKAIRGIVKWVESEDKTTALGPGTKVEQGKAYTWLFTPTDQNYKELTGTIVLWAKPSSGGFVTPAPVNPDVITVKEDTKDNTTSKPGAETGTTTTKTTVKHTTTATTKNEQGQDVSKTTASVSKDLGDKLLDQAVSNKSDTIEITVKSNETNNNGSGAGASAADSVKATEVELPKATVNAIAKDTNADLVIKTDNGEVVLDNKTLETIAGAAKGDTVTIVVGENTQLKETQKPAEKIVGKNGTLFDLAAKIGERLLHQFEGGKAHVTLPMPEKLKGKDVLVIYIDDNGLCKILNHSVAKIGAEDYIRFTTTHFSTFAVVDKDEAERLIKEQNAAHVKELMQSAKFKVTTTKTSKKSVKVQVAAKSSKTMISDIKSLGYTVKYQFYRSTKKTAGYKLLKTKTTSSFTNTKGKKGTKYYYKARVLVYDGKTLIAKSELKQASCGVRTWTK